MIHHYRCIQSMDSKTKALLITDISDYLREYLTQPSVTAEEIMTHTIYFLSAALKDVPNSICDSQLASIEAVRAIFSNWWTVEPSPPVYPTVLSLPKPIILLPKPFLLRYPAPTSKGDHENYRVTTSKVAFKQQTPVITMQRQVAFNSRGDQEPIAARKKNHVLLIPPSFLLLSQSRSKWTSGSMDEIQHIST